MNKFLEWFVRLWGLLIVVVKLIAIFGMFLRDGFWGGISSVQSTYSPFNIPIMVMELVLLLPAIIAYWWLERRRSKGKLT